MGLRRYYEPSLWEVLLLQILYFVALVLSPVVCVVVILWIVITAAVKLREGPRAARDVLSNRGDMLSVPFIAPFAATLDNGRVLVVKTLRVIYEVRKKRPPYGIATKRKVVGVGRLWSILPKFEKTYKYGRLRGDHDIRLLQIYPGQFDDSLQGKIITKNLLLNPRYAALSYTWADENGDASETGTLEVLDDDRIIRITANCERAIRRLRLPDKSRRVWIDAVCIDQGDLTERTHQVALMSRIYMSAAEVIAYTGEGTQQTDKLFDSLNDLSPEKIRSHSDIIIHDILGQAFTLTSPTDFTSLVRSLVLRTSEKCRAIWPSTETWKTVGQVEQLSETQILDLTRDYFSRRWFNRVWVLQEVALPDARHTTIMCGAKTISGERALYALSLLPDDGSSSMVRIFVAIRQKIMSPRKSHLLDVLIETRDRRSGDPRDKIFGVLSISQGLDEGRYPELGASYDLDTVQVYTKYSEFFIRHHGVGFFLSLTKPSLDCLPKLPSWSADWTVPWPNTKAVAGKQFAAASRPVNDSDGGVEFSQEDDGRILTITRRRIVRGCLTRDGHLDGSETTTIEDVEHLDEEHILIEMYSGVAALLRSGHEGYYVFIQTCPHALTAEGLHMLVEKWADIVVGGQGYETHGVESTDSLEYLATLDTYKIK